MIITHKQFSLTVTKARRLAEEEYIKAANFKSVAIHPIEWEIEIDPYTFEITYKVLFTKAGQDIEIEIPIEKEGIK